MEGADDFLIVLFREEVRTNCQKIANGLVTIEQGAASPERLEELMRAAHSIKGAARVVNVRPGVDVSHAMEDCIVRIQKGEFKLTAETVDVLLRGVDLLGEIADAVGSSFDAWLDAKQADVASLIQRLELVTQQKVPEATTVAPPAIAIAAPKVSPQEPADSSNSVYPAPIPAPPIESPKADTTSAQQSDDSVVRVTARNLTRLMGLAGESLVEARWLQPFSQALLQLKQMQDTLSSTVDDLKETFHSTESHERLAMLLGNARTELTACRNLLAERTAEFDRRMRNADDLSTRLYREVISSRMRPFRDGVQGLPRLVRDLARQLGKKVQLDILGETTEVDRDILEKLDAPLTHLVRNALDHGLESSTERQIAGKHETGRLRIEAAHRAGMLSITVSDDGRGVDLQRLRKKVVDRGLTSADIAQNLSKSELLEFLFLPGFSTASNVTEISGRGVGLDVVHSMVQSVGGRVFVQSDVGAGTSFRVQLPVTLSVLRAVIVEIAREAFAFPHNRIDRVLRVNRNELLSLEGREFVRVDGENIGVVLGRQALQLDGPESTSDDALIVLFGDQSARYGLVVDGLLGEQDLVIRPLDRRLGKVPDLHAAAILDDGSPVLIVDLDDLQRSIEKLVQCSRLRRADEDSLRQGARPRKRVLVVDDSITVREVQRQLLSNHGYAVDVGVDGVDGWNLVRQEPFDLVITDIDMPRLNGLELVRRMKIDSKLQSIPVVIVSYKDRDEDRLRGLEAGANYYLAKSSFHDETLVQVVRDLIGDAEI